MVRIKHALRMEKAGQAFMTSVGKARCGLKKKSGPPRTALCHELGDCSHFCPRSVRENHLRSVLQGTF